MFFQHSYQEWDWQILWEICTIYFYHSKSVTEFPCRHTARKTPNVLESQLRSLYPKKLKHGVGWTKIDRTVILEVKGIWHPSVISILKNHLIMKKQNGCHVRSQSTTNEIMWPFRRSHWYFSTTFRTSCCVLS